MKLEKKIVVIACYYGELPAWFRCWEQSCQYNANIDFVVITDQKIIPVASNVRIINIEWEELRARFSQVLGFNACLENAYKLCDYKPLFGWAFPELIDGYEFWGHCDIDTIWGDLTHFITDEILNQYDVIGSKGHLMFYKNNKKNAELFKKPGGIFSVKQVFSSKYNHGFDEMSGMDLIVRKNNVPQYKGIQIADIEPGFSRIKIFGDNCSCPQILVWQNGHIYQYFLQNGVKKQEYAYAHFQQRKMSAPSTSDCSSLLIINANSVERLDVQVITSTEIQRYSQYVNEEQDENERKMLQKKKILTFLKMNITEKYINLWMHRGISSFYKQ